MATLATSTPSITSTTLDPSFLVTMGVIVLLVFSSPFVFTYLIHRQSRHSPSFALRKLAPHVDTNALDPAP